MHKIKTKCYYLLITVLLPLSSPVWAITEFPGEPVVIEFDTEMANLDLTGGPFLMPLASDPANVLGDSVEGYGFVNSQVSISLSSTNGGPASVGKAFAFQGGELADIATDDSNGEPAIKPNELHGETFFVSSFFDVFFDITVTDVDNRPGRDYAGMTDGASILLPNNGPANLQTQFQAIFDKDAPNFGLIPPPETDPYIGHFDIVIPLGGDINGNGENDVLKFTLATHSVGNDNRTFVTLPDGSVLDQFNTAALLEGLVADESTDPPFTIGALLPSGLPDPNAFGGPTSVQSTLLTPVAADSVPIPPSLLLFGSGIVMLWRKKRVA